MRIIRCILILLVILSLSSITAYAEENNEQNIVICIDPGHGGENLGAEWQDYVEKEMTLKVANAMKEELEKYEGIEIYMTRTDDVDMSLEERIDYAADVNADFFFCLHFNMSEDHSLYGAENWISAFGQNYARGMDFAKIEMSLLTDLGLYDRGIKTRLNSKGTNYYDVLRMGDLENIPGVIIEHCHLDNYNDDSFYDNDSWLTEYGKLDATAVAMYYGLYSPELNKDYRGFTYEPTPIPDSVVKPDSTDPEYCSVKNGIVNIGTQATVDLDISAYDPDCRMLYYSVSYDGGLTTSEKYKWLSDDGSSGESIHVTVALPYFTDIRLVITAYNLHGLSVSSEEIFIPEISYFEDDLIVEDTPDYSEYETISPYDSTDFQETTSYLWGDSFTNAAIIVLVFLLFVVLVIMTVLIVINIQKRRKR